MTQFSAENQPKGRGRPKGAKGKKACFTDSLKAVALEHLIKAVNNGEPWAITLVLSQEQPTINQVVKEEVKPAPFRSVKS